MQINAFYRRSTASGDVAQLFAAVSTSSSRKATDEAPPGQNVLFRARFDSTLPVSQKNAMAKIIAILAGQNPGSLISGIANIQGSLAHIIQGTDGADTIAYAGGNAGSRQLSSYIDTGGGDDVISFASVGSGYNEISGGDGNDAIAASAQYFSSVDGGSGNDAVAVAGEWVSSVQGGSGNDAIAVAASLVNSVGGGDGDDVISVAGGYVGWVEGGAGNDTISVSSDNSRYYKGGSPSDLVTLHGTIRGVNVVGGKGNDTISIGGEGYVITHAGDGQDVIAISDRTEFEFLGEKWNDKLPSLKDATFVQENGTLTVTFAGRDDRLTIQAGGREMKVEQIWDSKFVVTLVDPAATSAPAPAK